MEDFMPELNEFNQLVGDQIENWSPCPCPSKNILSGRYCNLELLNIEKHSKDLFAALLFENNGESWTYLSCGPFEKIAEFNQWIETTTAKSDPILYAVLDKKTQMPIGISGYLRIFPEHGTIEIGHIHFSQKLKKTPLATEAIYLMISHAFDELNYRRLEWKCNSLNEASKNAALRYGFQYEGTFRQMNVFKDRNRDTAWFSILDTEWPKLKIKFEKWLDKSNFDNNGNQLKRLQDY